MADANALLVDRFSVVASFYGPGTIAAWLCTLFSLFITWCFNAEYSHKDTFSLDYVFSIAVPAVSSVHALYQIFSPLEGSSKQESGSLPSRSLFISQEPDILQRAAAIEAALNVCETFAAATVALVFIAMLRCHVRRMLVTVAAGLIAFLPEAAILVLTNGLQVSQSNLSRPFLFNFFEVMVVILAFLVVWGTVLAIILLVLPSWRQDASQDQLEQETAMTSLSLRREVAGEEAMEIDHEVLREAEDRRIRQQGDNIKILTMVSMAFLPLTFFTSVFGATGAFGPTTYMSTQDWQWRLPFFIPRSSTHVTELDQVVSLSTGTIALLWSMWDAFKSQERAAAARKKKSRELQAQVDKFRRQQQMKFKLKVLREVNEQLDQGSDAKRRQELIKVRETVANQMSLLLDV